ncbi:hypothetical protein PoB_002057300 [Plakobranchus ocellatus]|uniref:Uncharacterized protein n=1 Tax=Plakobranchus ocellatus TaxID=259542 RepID=A0AAV3ZGZ1_9GAST|nr:hypothetical protein PoB_002057300 [Plakobranchus ocellatus]
MDSRNLCRNAFLALSVFLLISFVIETTDANPTRTPIRQKLNNMSGKMDRANRKLDKLRASQNKADTKLDELLEAVEADEGAGETEPSPVETAERSEIPPHGFAGPVH